MHRLRSLLDLLAFGPPFLAGFVVGFLILPFVAGFQAADDAMANMEAKERSRG